MQTALAEDLSAIQPKPFDLPRRVMKNLRMRMVLVALNEHQIRVSYIKRNARTAVDVPPTLVVAARSTDRRES